MVFEHAQSKIFELKYLILSAFIFIFDRTKEYTLFFIRGFGGSIVMKVFVTNCQVSIVIENNSLLYSIVINEKLV